MRWVWGLVGSVIVTFACCLARPSWAQERSLYYRELGVTALLDADGRLHVEERQVMVFDGAWNGGERWFSLSGAQELEVKSVARVNADGVAVHLGYGDLSYNDQYQIRDKRTLRWRARQPDAPPFEHTEIIYVISYVLSNILVDEGDTYLLDHDFAFADRPGIIQRFRLDLKLDPAWQPQAALDRSFASGPLAPGTGFVVTAALDHIGVGDPSAVLPLASTGQRLAAVAALLGASLLLFGRLFLRETKLGRFAPLLPLNRIDRGWLAQHVFALPPELVGALHDRRVGQPEVIATIARMVEEQKLASRVTPESPSALAQLELWLLVERSSLRGYERALVDQLFVAGNSTSTSAIRAHYAKTKFDPTKCLRDELHPQADALLGVRPRPRWLLAAAIVLLAVSAIHLLQYAFESTRPPEATLFIGLPTIAFSTFFGGFIAHWWVSEVERPWPLARPFLGMVAFTSLVLAAVMLWWPALPSLFMASLAYLGIAGNWIVALLATSRDQPSGMALRKRLASARRFFAVELTKAEPRIENAWFPYLVAFDLVKEMDQWFRAFGAATNRSSFSNDWTSSSGSSSASSSLSSSSASSNGGGWTGGGGAFGGAGASGSWVAATGVLAAGVNSSGSRSSSGSSSSSSSGGGGGGGW